MFERWTRRSTQSLTAVEQELASVRKVLPNCSDDPYVEAYYGYLGFAQDCGLGGKHIVLSCRDLAITKDSELHAQEQSKVRGWEATRRESGAIAREKREVTMKLYPQYFEGILRGVKKYEGRAYDPGSDKDYANLREGDSIVYSISQEFPGWQEEVKKWGLEANMRMKCEVGRIFFAPTVHGMYQYTPALGAEFQPYLSGVSELLQLQRVGVYYSFPGYPEKISKHGFRGIEMRNPR